MDILVPILAVTIIGLLCAVGLSVASALMAVKVDERFPAIRECLPGANCGACGFSGCDGYAKALLQPGTKTNLCVPGADTVAKKLSALLGVEAENVVEKVAVVKCGGTCEKTQPRDDYHGIRSCAAARLFFGGGGSCAYGCLGLGDCAKACPQNAISLVKGVAVIEPSLCTGCGLCAKACPQSVIAVVPDTARTAVLCSNRDPGSLTHKVCTAGCIACHKCEKSCEAGAITVAGNLAAIDYDKCQACGKCAEGCPTGAIVKRDYSGASRFRAEA
jgi:electron transport complex protein RnfB